MRREEGPLGTALFDGPRDEWRLRLDIPIPDLQCQGGPLVALIGVNPSTANAHIKDQTIRKDMGFAQLHRWGCITKLNLFGWRETDIRRLALSPDPVGARNDEVIAAACLEADLVIGCWGPTAKLSGLPLPLRGRWRAVANIVWGCGKRIFCFGSAGDGQPLHTLMLPYSALLQEWEPPLSAQMKGARK